MTCLIRSEAMLAKCLVYCAVRRAVLLQGSCSLTVPHRTEDTYCRNVVPGCDSGDIAMSQKRLVNRMYWQSVTATSILQCHSE